MTNDSNLPREVWIGWPDGETPEVVEPLHEADDLSEVGCVKFIEKSEIEGLSAQLMAMSLERDQLTKELNFIKSGGTDEATPADEERMALRIERNNLRDELAGAKADVAMLDKLNVELAEKLAMTSPSTDLISEKYRLREQLTEARAEIERLHGYGHDVTMDWNAAVESRDALIERCEKALKDGDQYNRKQALTEIASFKKGEK